MIRKTCALVVAALTAGFFSANASLGAAPVGTVNFTGDANVSLGFVDFLPLGGGAGTVAVTAPASQSGTFVPLAGTLATLKDLPSAAGPVAVPAALVFAADPDIAFDISFLAPGIFPPPIVGPAAPGQVGTPPGTMYNLVNLPGAPVQTGLSFAVAGTATRLSTLESVPFTGIFTMQFADASYQELLASWSEGGSKTTSFSATFTAVPEPASLGVLAAGSLLLMRRRRA